jgi:hypothetical protein
VAAARWEEDSSQYHVGENDCFGERCVPFLGIGFVLYITGKTPEDKIQRCIEYGWSTTPYRMYTEKQTLTEATAGSPGELCQCQVPFSPSSETHGKRRLERTQADSP